jgi:transcriptional regulator NrdR family protein
MPRKGQHDGMRCPRCGVGRMRPYKRVAEDEFFWVRRYRHCSHCSYKARTTESIDGPLPTILTPQSIEAPIQAIPSGDIDGQQYLFEE